MQFYQGVPVFAEDLVLIADDEPDQLEAMSRIVTDTGRRVLLAHNGVAALELFKKYQPGLVLLDIDMPEMNGIEVMQAIKALAEGYFVPVILTSVDRCGGIMAKTARLGADGFLDQPFNPDLLRSQLLWNDRSREFYYTLKTMMDVRQHESEVAQELFTDALEKANVCQDVLNIFKQPAEIFSGDIQLTAYRPNGNLHILLGDFTGHGLTATVGALPMAETFRAMTAKGYSGAEIVRQINSKLAELLPTGMFLSMAFVCLNLHKGTLAVLNAGMPDLLLFSAEGEVLRFPSVIPPLGILPRLTDISFSYYRYRSDDCLLMLSDGVTEAQNSHEELFGEERLIDVAQRAFVQGESLVQAVTASLKRYCNGLKPADDISLIEVPVGQLIPGRILTAQPGSDKSQSPDFTESVAESRWQWSMHLSGAGLQKHNLPALAMAHIHNLEGGDEHWQKVSTILTELYVNALDHGVLELDSALKSSAEGFAYYFTERDVRLSNLAEGFVELELEHEAFANGGRLRIRMQDSGKGFETRPWLEGREASEAGLSGRGIKLIMNLAASLCYSHSGACAEAVYTYST